MTDNDPQLEDSCLEKFPDRTQKHSHLQKFLKNLKPDLACEIKQCWIEPGDINIGHLLGKGNTVSNATEIPSCFKLYGLFQNVFFSQETVE